MSIISSFYAQLTRVLASIMGSVNSSRTMGGCIALSVCSAILHSRTNTLSSVLPPGLAAEVTNSPTIAMGDLSPEQAYIVRQNYAESYQLQWVTITALGAVAVIASLGPVMLSNIKPDFPEKPVNIQLESPGESSEVRVNSKS